MFEEFDFSSVVEEYLPARAREELIANLKRFHMHEDVYILEHAEEHFSKLVRNDLAAGHQEDDLILGLPEIARVKYALKWKALFREYLSGLQPAVRYEDEEFESVTRAKHPYIEELQRRKESHFDLLHATATGTGWSEEGNKRVYTENTVYRLTNRNTEARITFTAPFSEPFLHVLMFDIPEQLQGRYGALRANFKGFFEALTDWNTLMGFESLLLGAPHGVPPVRGREWRWDYGPYGEPKLLRLWRCMGAVTPYENDPNRLYFCKYPAALEFKRKMTSEGYENPYRHLYRGIYSRSEEDRLKA